LGETCSARENRQQVTNQWWEQEKDRYELYISELVVREASSGDAEAAQRRLDSIRSIKELVIDSEMEAETAATEEIKEEAAEVVAVTEENKEETVDIAAETAAAEEVKKDAADVVTETTASEEVKEETEEVKPETTATEDTKEDK